MLRLEKTLFGVLIALALSIIILPKFYITGDGPSHTYNARILFDFLNGTHRSFYESYYTVNRNIDPNWTSHILIGLLLKIVPYWLADKMVQVLYLLLFTLSFRYFIASLQRENTFLSFLFFPFLFTLGYQHYCHRN